MWDSNSTRLPCGHSVLVGGGVGFERFRNHLISGWIFLDTSSDTHRSTHKNHALGIAPPLPAETAPGSDSIVTDPRFRR